MGIWKEIKYALNSKLGQKGFVPLDVLIRNQNVLYASDNLYISLLSELQQQVDAGKTIYIDVPVKFIASNDGSCKIKFKLPLNSSLSYIRLYKNSELLEELRYLGTSAPELKSFNTIYFSAGDIFTLKIQTKNTTVFDDYIRIEDLSIYGDIKQGIFKVEAV